MNFQISWASGLTMIVNMTIFMFEGPICEMYCLPSLREPGDGEIYGQPGAGLPIQPEHFTSFDPALECLLLVLIRGDQIFIS